MLLGGDELGRTQQGNNNAYCQDNEVSWVDWGLTRSNADLVRFFKLLIQFRKEHLAFRHASFDENQPRAECHVLWHGVRLHQPDWSWQSRALAVQFSGGAGGGDIFLIANAYWEPLTFELPALLGGRQWRRKLDTSRPSPEDIVESGQEPALRDQKSCAAGPRSVVALVGR